MMCRAWSVLLVLGGLGAELPAQAPLPALASDSVVRLAIDPARGGGVPYVTLLEDGHYRLEPDGRSRYDMRQVVQVLDANAARSLAERAFGYDGSRQTLTVRWVRVLRPDGTVLSDRAAQEQDGEVPAAMQSPIYTNQRLKRLSLGGVAAGTIVDVAWSMEQRTPARPGDFLVNWSLMGLVPVRRSQFIFDTPASYQPQIVERNLLTRREERVEQGRRLLTWRAADQQGVRPEPFAADSNDLVPSLLIGPAGGWRDVARWYDSLATDRYVVSRPVAARADSVLAAARPRTRADTVRALHRWIAQDVRYVSVSLGLGGYQPRTPDEVLRTGFGDCKDKTTLFVALLRRAGIEADPVLLSLTSRPNRAIPSMLQFNHAIAAVRDGAEWRYADLTADVLPYGDLPEQVRGAFALRVARGGGAEPLELPTTPLAEPATTLRLQLQVDSAGRAIGTGREEATGWPAMALRQMLAAPLDSARRAALSQSVAQRLMGPDVADAVIDSVRGTNGRDLATPPVLQFRATIDRVVQQVGATRVLRVPLAARGPARQFRTARQSLEALPRRRLPIDGARVLPPMSAAIDWQITLPAGWTVELPPNVNTTSFFGSYESRWTLNGRDLRLVRRLTGRRGIVGPERMAEILVWFRTVGADDQEFLTMKPTGAR